jgi:hypothetical protein
METQSNQCYQDLRGKEEEIREKTEKNTEQRQRNRHALVVKPWNREIPEPSHQFGLYGADRQTQHHPHQQLGAPI